MQVAPDQPTKVISIVARLFNEKHLSILLFYATGLLFITWLLFHTFCEERFKTIYSKLLTYVFLVMCFVSFIGYSCTISEDSGFIFVEFLCTFFMFIVLFSYVIYRKDPLLLRDLRQGRFIKVWDNNNSTLLILLICMFLEVCIFAAFYYLAMGISCILVSVFLATVIWAIEYQPYSYVK